jgi:hypothetical protein
VAQVRHNRAYYLHRDGDKKKQSEETQMIELDLSVADDIRREENRDCPPHLWFGRPSRRLSVTT